jgi:gas vesicle protein
MANILSCGALCLQASVNISILTVRGGPCRAHLRNSLKGSTPRDESRVPRRSKGLPAPIRETMGRRWQQLPPAPHLVGRTLRGRRKIRTVRKFQSLPAKDAAQPKGEKYMSADRGGFGWFLIGLGIGAAAGVLYAPKAGQETREELASSAREGSEYVRQQSRRAAEKVSDIADRGRDQLNEYVDRGKDAVDRGRSQWNQYVDRGRQVVSDQVDKVSEAVDEGKRAYHNTASGDDAERISSAVEAGQQAYRTT